MMEYLITFQQFLDKLDEQEKLEKERQRFKELAGIKKTEGTKIQFSIQLTFEKPTGADLLTEHKQYTQFQNTTNRHTRHPENTTIPVKAHYHIVPSNSNKELYAVNVDGTAHHKKNRGHIVPKKEADELRTLGVTIPTNNIIESKQWFITESIADNYLTFFLILDEE
ncbi:MAG: hypothetical protein IPP77_04490 [Bacteroidetes bacterium]|nr:hypothetical protein [Bacteroidota bacterium]